MADSNQDSSLYRRHLLSLCGRKLGPDPGELLGQVAGVCFCGGHEAFFDLGEAVAEMHLAADGSIRLRTVAVPPSTGLAALHASSRLPGNLRFSQDQRGTAIIADTQINGAAHLSRTFAWLRQGLCQALQPAEPATLLEDSNGIERRDVQQALAQLPWAAEGLVEQEDGWELRPRIRGDAVPVRVTVEGSHVGVARVVLPLPEPETPAAAAVGDQAIRINDQLRHARLAARDGQLVAEARLHGGLVDRGWLSQTAYAVAQAGRYAVTPLRILAEQPQVAETYVAVFCSTVEQPASTGAGR